MNNSYDWLSNNCLWVLSPLDAIQQEALDYFDAHGSRQKPYAECLAAYTEAPEDEEAPVISGITNWNTYTTSATFSITDNEWITSVTLDGESLASRTNVTVTEIGTHTLIAKDAANNTTTVSFTIKAKTTSWWGGWGWYYVIPEEDDDDQWEQEQEREEVKVWWWISEEKAKEIVEVVVWWWTRTVTVTREIKEAYEFAKEKKITTTEDIEEFDLEWKLIRMHLAKMISEFAVEVMWKKEMTEWVEGCENFEDMKNETEEMQKYATMACKLGLMWRNGEQTAPQKKFNPTVEVNRAQFGTILSRLLRWQQYAAKEWESYYGEHLQALKESGIMTMIDPEMSELRWWVALMLYRVWRNK